MSEDIRLELTCCACPEQYDAYIGSRQIGYLRLRHGHFCAQYPDAGGEVVYSANTRGDGMFYEDERDLHLNAAKSALMSKFKEQSREFALETLLKWAEENAVAPWPNSVTQFSPFINLEDLRAKILEIKS